MQKYLLIPLSKNPYSRLGPLALQDWYRQAKRTVELARRLRKENHEVTILLISSFQAKGKASELEIYSETFRVLAPELKVLSYRETTETIEQVEKSFKLAKEIGAQPVFISTWMHYPRVRYLARFGKALHYGVFGIPQPAFALIDPLWMILQPLVDLLRLRSFFQKFIMHQREKGKILF